MKEQMEQKSFMSSLWERRFFQYFATYIGVCWGILQFIVFGVGRYGFDTSFIDKFLIFALILLPGVCVFIYNHGRSGDDLWTKFEKWFIPLNIAVAIGAALFTISGKSATANVSEEVTLTTDEGDVITRNVPNVKYTNRVVVFPFVLEDPVDEDSKWLRYALAVLVDAEFDQDMRFSSYGPASISYYYKSYNESLDNDISTGTKLKIAKDLYTDYYIDGNIVKNVDGYNLKIEVRSTDDGKIYFDKEYQDADYFNVVDAFANDINEKIYSKEFFKDVEIIDFPAKELITSNPIALENYINGILESDKQGDQTQSLAFLTKSIEADANCALCYLKQAIAFSGMNDPDKAKESMKNALDRSSKMTERSRLETRYMSYQLNQNPDKSKKLLETWMQLYPSDSRPFERQMFFYTMLQDKVKAIKIGEQAYKNGHRGSFLTKLADLHIKSSELSEAEKYLKEFAELYPDKSKENSQLGDILLQQGKLDKALEFYEMLQIKSGESFSNSLKIASVYDRKGEFSNADIAIEEAFKYCNQTADTLAVYNTLRSHLMAQGKANESIDKYFESEKVAAKIYPQIAIDAQLYLQSMYDFAGANRIDEWLETGLSRFPNDDPQSTLIKSLLNYMHASAVDDKERYLQYAEDVAPLMQKVMGDDYKGFSDAFIAKLDGDYDKAAGLVVQYADATNADHTVIRDMLCEIYMLGDQPQKCLDYAEKVLEIDPHNHAFLYQALSATHALGMNKKAKGYLSTLEAVLTNADETFVTAINLKEFKANNSIN